MRSQCGDALPGRPHWRMDLLLLSNSTNHGDHMFPHAAEAFVEVAAGDLVTFVRSRWPTGTTTPNRVTAAFGAFDIEVVSAHRAADPDRAILDAPVVMMGGGNTFRLLDSLYGLDVVERPGRTRARRRDPLHGRVGRHERRVPDDPHDERHADLPPADASTRSASCRSRSTCTTSTPTRHSTFMGETREERIERVPRGERLSGAGDVRGLVVAGARRQRATVTGPATAVPARRAGRPSTTGVDVSHLLGLHPTLRRRTAARARSPGLRRGSRYAGGVP